MSNLRRPTNTNGSNATDTPFTGAGARHCMTCNKWRQLAGGGKDRRTGFWRCAGCVAARAATSTAT